MPTLYDKLTNKRYNLLELVKKYGGELSIGRKKSWFQFWEKQPVIQLGTNFEGYNVLPQEYKEIYGLSINHAKLVYDKEIRIFSIIKNKSSSTISILRKNHKGEDKPIMLSYAKNDKIIAKETLMDNDGIIFGIYGPVIYQQGNFK